jgi:hypothetical protein
VEDSWPPTTRTINYTAADFDTHITAKERRLYRVTDLDAWRADNRAGALLFPNYEEDAATPVINRVLLLDRGDWVAYHKDQPVRINVMDRDSQGVRTLIVKRGDDLVEEAMVQGPGVIECPSGICGDYTAHCVMADGSLSQACEFSVCDLGFRAFPKEVTVGKAWRIGFESSNMDVVIVHLKSDENPYGDYSVFVTEQDRRRGEVTIPADLVQDAGNWQVWLIGEHRYGRLKARRDLTAVE